MESDQFDRGQIDGRRRGINERYARVKEMAQQRREKLNKAITVHQFLRDIDEEESWIKLGETHHIKTSHLILQKKIMNFAEN